MPRNRKRTIEGEECKEIEQLRKRRKKAQEKGDGTEEAKLCNALGEIYIQKGDYLQALHYHQCELSISKASGDRLGYGIACRRVGECYCELGDYGEAVEFQKRHLEIARQLVDLAEQQRALATLGRTFYVHSQSELESRSEGDGRSEEEELLLKAGSHYLQSLDLCDRLTGELSDKELLEMRSRLYLNLGLVYETKGDLKSGRKFMDKALDILKELGDSLTVFQCHFDLGHLHLKERHTSHALSSFQAALVIARELRNRRQEAETLQEMAQVYIELSEFELAKSCCKRVIKLAKSLGLPQEDVEKQLKYVRRILSYTLEVESKDDAKGKVHIYEKLGDLCCKIKSYSSAIKFYGKQLSVAEEFLNPEPEEKSSIYISLARTLSDNGQHSQALLYYGKILRLCKGNVTEECDTWHSIGVVRENAKMAVDKVMEAYNNSVSLAEEMESPKKMMALYKVIIRFISEHEDSSSFTATSPSYPWRQKLSCLLESHPSLADTEGCEEKEEDSQGLNDHSQSTSDDFSLSSSEEEENDEEMGVALGGVPTQERSSRGVALRRVSKLEKRNDRGETLLQVAVINGDLAAVRQLIKKGAEVNTRDNCGWIPLHEACNHGYLEIASLLIENGASIDDGGGASCEGVTPLIDAATNGHVGVVELLVDRGADLTVQDTNGRTALDVVENRLLLGRLDRSYELEQEHTDIRDYLRVEMRGRGLYVKEATPPDVGVEDEAVGSSNHEANRCGHRKPSGGRGRSSGGHGRSSGGRGRFSGGHGKHSGECEGSFPTTQKRYERWKDRTLYDSSEEEDYLVARSSKKAKLQTDSTPPLSPSPSPSTSKELLSPLYKERNISINSAAGRRGSLHARGGLISLGQAEVPTGPALVPADGAALLEGEVDETSGYPVVDQWLVDDLGEGQTKKRERHRRDLSVERESRALVGLPVSSSSKSCGDATKTGTRDHHHHHRKNQRLKSRIHRGMANRVSAERLAYSSERKRRGREEEEEGGRFSLVEGDSGSHGTLISKGNKEVHIEVSDSEEEEDFLNWQRNLHPPPEDELAPNMSSSDLQTHSSTPSYPPISHSTSSSHRIPPPPPLRVRVRIGDSSYLIPCPALDANGRDTSISWLTTQAAERYFSQRGKRPLLSLTTPDGASLCPADSVAHVLRQDDEVVGVVEEWFCPPLAERYQVACRTAGVECHQKTLELFEKSGLGSSLDLSNFDLAPRDPSPLFNALQSQHNLTSINFSGSRLRDEAMPRLQAALGGLPSLHSLDLSSIGITYQGLNSLVKLSSLPSGSNGMWKSLHSLNLSHNKLGVASGSGLSKLLLHCQGMQELLLEACGLGYDVFEACNEAMKCLSELRVLSLNNNPLGSRGLHLLLGGLHGLLKVSTLSISRTVSAKITGDNRPLSELLRDQMTLEYFKEGGGQYLETLDVSHCSRGDGKAVGALMECLEHCSGLKTLRLAGWGLTGEHIEPICSYLSFADCLCTLDISGNVSLGNSGALRLLNACCSRLSLGEGENEGSSQKLRLKLTACGLESPLPNELIRAVHFLQGRSGDVGGLFEVELFGNLVDKRDMSSLLSSSSSSS